jgi:hypothetical protein
LRPRLVERIPAQQQILSCERVRGEGSSRRCSSSSSRRRQRSQGPRRQSRRVPVSMLVDGRQSHNPNRRLWALVAVVTVTDAVAHGVRRSQPQRGNFGKVRWHAASQTFDPSPLAYCPRRATRFRHGRRLEPTNQTIHDSTPATHLRAAGRPDDRQRPTSSAQDTEGQFCTKDSARRNFLSFNSASTLKMRGKIDTLAVKI